MRQKENEVASSCLPTCQASTTAHSFITALTETRWTHSGKSVPPCFLISDVFCLTASLVSVAPMNMEGNYGPTSEVMPNSTRDGPMDHEIILAQLKRKDKFGLVRGIFISGKFHDLYFMFNALKIR